MGALPHPVLALAGCPSVADLVLGAFEVLHESAGFEKGLMGLHDDSREPSSRHEWERSQHAHITMIILITLRDTHEPAPRV